MKISLGLVFVIAATYLISREFQKLFKEIEKDKKLGLIVLIREIFLGATGFYFIFFLIGLLLIISEFTGK